MAVPLNCFTLMIQLQCRYTLYLYEVDALPQYKGQWSI